MRKVFLLIMVCFIFSACSSKSNQVNYYKLPVADLSEYKADSNADQIYLASVSVSDMLGGRGIVYQISDVEYTVARNNQWMEPLGIQLQESVAGKLRGLVPNKMIFTEKKIRHATHVYIKLTGFHGKYNGNAVVKGSYAIVSPTGEYVVRGFSYEIPQTEDGYSSLIKALDAGSDKLAGDIALALSSE